MDANERIQKGLTRQMMKQRNIIFDFDGVIADTEYGRYKLLAKILKEFGIKFDKDFSVKDIAGTPTDIFLYKNYKNLSQKERNYIVEKRRKIFLDNLPEYCRVYPGAPETIKYLNKQGYEVSLATTNELEVAEKLIQFVGVDQEFQHKLYRSQINNPKNKSKDYSLLLRLLKYKPSDCIVIEDSIVGVSSAKKNHMYCIAFNRYSENKITELADIVVNDYDELIKLFEDKR